jgi:hypothetical protein
MERRYPEWLLAAIGHVGDPPPCGRRPRGRCRIARAPDDGPPATAYGRRDTLQPVEGGLS